MEPISSQRAHDLHASGPFGRTVDRLVRPSMREFKARQYGGPLILAHCMDDWKLLAKLQSFHAEDQKLLLLKTLLGKKKVHFNSIPASKQGQFGYGPNLKRPNFDSDGKKQYFSKMCELISRSLAGKSSRTIYMQSTPLHTWPQLAREIGTPPYFKKKIGRYGTIWIGSGGQVVNLHYDFDMNFIFMLAGKKRVSLLPFQALPRLYPGPLDRGFGGAPSSCVRLLAPDSDRFPLFRSALKSMMVASLEPGDILYVPPYWWHHVESSGLNAMINIWVHDIPRRRQNRLNTNKYRAMVLFYEMSERDRRRFRRLYLRSAFGDSRGPSGQEGTRTAAGLRPFGIDKVWLHEIDKHLRDTIRLNRELPEYHRRINKTFYDHYVFRMHGDPAPSLPGEYARMLERMHRLSSMSHLAKRP